MPPPITPSLLGRRSVVSGLAATTAGPLIPGTVGLAQTTSLLPTPRQTAGPFYPVDWSRDADADLVQVSGEPARAQGVVTHLRGRVLGAVAGVVGNLGDVVSGLCSKPKPTLTRRRRPRHGQG